MGVCHTVSGKREGAAMQNRTSGPGRERPPEKDRPHQGLNTLAFLLPPAGVGLYLSCRCSAPRRAASLARWSWAGVGFYAVCYLLLALGAWFLY